MRPGRTTEIGLALLVLAGVSVFARARMGPTDARTLPYEGTLEQGGAAANGSFLMRFGLFVSTPTANDLLCVADDACALWSEEQLVDVTNGRFSVKLGDSDGDLTDLILANNTLYLGVAVKPAADPGAFTILDGAQEIVPQPWAARAARANAFRITGGLTVEGGGAAITGNSTVTGSLAVSGALAAQTVTSLGNIATVNGSFTTSTGNISTTTGTVTGAALTATGTVTAASANITNGLPITLTDPFVGVADNDGSVNFDLGVPSARSACFVTEVYVHDTFLNESQAECNVYPQNGTWFLYVNSNNGGGDPDTRCSVRCLRW